MNEQELKEVLQGVIDGKELQCKWSIVGEWEKVNWDTLSTLIAGLNAYHEKFTFRVKPEVKTFKYTTRPYSFIVHSTGDRKFGVWAELENVSQEYLEAWGKHLNFKWLAPTTTHEVEYE